MNKRTRNRARVVVGIVLLLVIAAAATWLILRPHPAAQWVDPDLAAYEKLKAASAIEPELYFENGFPRGVRLDIQVPGATPAERAINYLSTYQDFYHLDRAGNAVAVSRSISLQGIDAVTVYQTFNGVPVHGGEMVVSLKGDHVWSTVGALRPDLSLNVIPSSTATGAEAIARAYLGLPADSPVIGATTLMIFDRSLSEDVPSDPHLVWRVTSLALLKQVLVDDATGEVLLTIRMTDLGEAGYIDLSVKDAYDFFNYDNTYCFQNLLQDPAADENGVAPAYNGDPDALAAFLDARITYDYFYSAYDMNSWDHAGEQIKIYIHANLENAAWLGICNAIEFGTGWITLDILAHEYTHGIIAHTGVLEDPGQPSALNESYADLQSVMVDPSNWIHGDGRPCCLSDPGRDLSNPSAKSMPDRFSEYFYTSDDDDGGGSHTNMSINSYAYYLIAEGGTHPDTGITVQGIGRDQMGRLAFIAMQTVPSSAKFIDARNQTIWIAQGRGYSDFEICQIRNAFHAVEIGEGDLDCDGTPDQDELNTDNDTIQDSLDNCPFVYNPSQQDTDKDGRGDACDLDVDGDGVPQQICFSDICSPLDNCPAVPNATQLDSDHDGLGNACETHPFDGDGDGFIDLKDNCPLVPNHDQKDSNANGIGDACEATWPGSGSSIIPDGNSNDIEITGSVTQLPLPACPPAADDQSSQQLLFSGVPDNLQLTVIDDGGQNAGSLDQQDGDGEMGYTPQGGHSYFLLALGDALSSSGAAAHFSVSVICSGANMIAPTWIPGTPTASPTATFTATSTATSIMLTAGPSWTPNWSSTPTATRTPTPLLTLTATPARGLPSPLITATATRQPPPTPTVSAFTMNGRGTVSNSAGCSTNATSITLSVLSSGSATLVVTYHSFIQNNPCQTGSTLGTVTIYGTANPGDKTVTFSYYDPLMFNPAHGTLSYASGYPSGEVFCQENWKVTMP